MYANLGWQVAKGVTLSPFFRYSHYNGHEDGGSFSIDTSYTYSLSNLQAGIRSLITVGKGQLHLVYAYNRSDRSDYDDSLPNLATKGNFYSDVFTGYEHYAEAYLSYPLAPTGITVVGGQITGTCPPNNIPWTSTRTLSRPGRSIPQRPLCRGTAPTITRWRYTPQPH